MLGKRGSADRWMYFTASTLDIPEINLKDVQRVIGVYPDGLIGINSIRAMLAYIFRSAILGQHKCSPWYNKY